MKSVKIVKSNQLVQKIKPLYYFINSLLIGFLPKRFARRGRETIINLPHHIVGAEYIYLGERISIGGHSYIHAIDEYAGKKYSPRIQIGDDVYIGRNCYINAVSIVDIKEGCVLSEEVYLADEGHGLEPDAGLIMKQTLTNKGPITIGAHTFIGLRAAIMPGVVLGEHCVVGTSAVVTRSFPSYSMIVGNPARLIKRYNPDRHVWENVRNESTN